MVLSIYLVKMMDNKIIYLYFNKIISFIINFNPSITGLLPNTTYTCCVLAVTSYGESEPVCQISQLLV